ncbi:ABC transporter substrate-binding protein [Kutzneria kofuensis]|uniref:Peptide/nickel transport system substrate-binding protein n=1 Tax=Kutzneria kofuensis TaxID=103725 RepID=A0A7W9KK06_9PSEU|nr:ABC transporter substrate-binding protein [Kutzneria kofuensis]MBB5893862.1 peptide/nickel transport system substrate-binding protein [Kutzneria kofuensis]
MKRKRVMAAVAVATALATGLTACGGGSGSSGSGGSASAFNAANGKVVNPSDAKGGTIRMANSGDWDSLDPADMYYGYEWNFARLTGRGLLMFASAPGQEGTKLVPDLATSLGQSSDGGKTWTYKLRTGVKFEDGATVTSKDVKYAVERSLDKSVFPDGPTYFNDYLDLQGYTSPYNDPSADKLGLKAIETPDDTTIVFHLKTAFSGFDYFAALPSTQPVQQAKDTGSKYKEHVVSTGPYKFAENNLGKNFKLVRNDQWDAKTDPNRKALPDEIDVSLNTNADDIDSRLISGDLDVDIAGTGVQAAAQGKILANPQQKAQADNPVSDRLWYAGINGDVAPLDNVHCRRAVEYAADKTSYQAAYGGPTGGEIATNLLPPVTQGAQKFDTYPTPNNAGDEAKAKQELQACGQPSGFSTNISYRAERPKEKAAAEALQQSLSKVGIKLTIKPYPQGDYFKLYAGKPDFAKNNGLGIMLTGWQGDWTDGFGFLAQIVDSRVIRATGGNTNLTVKDPAVDAAIDKALTTSDTDARNKAWVDVDKKVMDNAWILPGIWAKALLYRPKNLTNVFVNDAYGMYDYLALGVKK